MPEATSVTLILLSCWRTFAFPPGLNATTHAFYVDGVEAESYVREEGVAHKHLVEMPDDGQSHEVRVQARLGDRVNDGESEWFQCENACDLNRDGVTGMKDFGLFTQEQYGRCNDGVKILDECPVERGGRE